MSETLTKRERKARIRRGQPIEALGLQFYPITMTDYEEFLECKGVLALRMTSLAKQSFEYITMPFLSALWAVDYDTARATGKPVGMLQRIVLLLCLSLRLGHDEQDKLLHGVYCDRSNPRSLHHIEVTQDGKTVQINPVDFTTTVRPLIADQNGIELPDESFNPELVEEEQNIAQEKAAKLHFNIDTLIASVANASGLREGDIDEWTVIEFERRRQAIDRALNYSIYAQAEMSGMVKFKKGNPYQSWCFDSEKGLSPALKTTGELKGKLAALGDIEQAVAQGTNQNTDQEI